MRAGGHEGENIGGMKLVRKRKNKFSKGGKHARKRRKGRERRNQEGEEELINKRIKNKEIKNKALKSKETLKEK